jgi:outer membrane protein assembly factor BamA
VAPVGESWWAGAEALYRNIGVTAPRGDRRSAQDVFGDSVPGLLTGAELASAGLFLTGDTRDRLYVPRSGGLYSFEASRNFGIDSSSEFEYWKYRAELQQSFPITSDKRKIITLRGTVETNQPTNDDGDIPFVDLAIIGSWDTLRGFANQRYYDNSAATFSLEYRYQIYRAFDWAFFADVGQVGQEIGDFHWEGFHAGFGARWIVWVNKNLPASIEAARSNEQWRFYFQLRPRF